MLTHCTSEEMFTPSRTCSSLDNFSAKASALEIAHSHPSIIISISCSSLAFNSWYSSTASSSPPATLWFSPLGTDSCVEKESKTRYQKQKVKSILSVLTYIQQYLNKWIYQITFVTSICYLHTLFSSLPWVSLRFSELVLNKWSFSNHAT